MYIFKGTLIAALFAASTAIAAPVSGASLRELLEVTQSRKLVDNMRAQVEAQIGNDIQKSLDGKTPNAKEQQAISKMKDRMIALTVSELTWEKLEPMYMRMYKEAFTEEEVGGLLAFYKTPAGQALITKMPMLMQKIMAEVQTMVGAMVPRMQSIQKEFAADMKEASQ